MTPELEKLLQQDAFTRRHIGPGPDDQKAMLNMLGVSSLEELIDRAVPKAILAEDEITTREPLTELQLSDHLWALSNENIVARSYIGLGYNGTVLPGVIQRKVLEAPGWYTAYTPYQAEVSQGRLEALLNFQQMIIDLTGMELANASLLDEGTAAAEAMTLMKRLSPSASDRLFVDADTHPQTVAVIETRAQPLGLEIVVGDPEIEMEGEYFGVLLSYPGSSGRIPDLPELISKAKNEAGALVTVAADILSLVLLTPPGELGADIVVGSAQRFGVPMGFGGPHAAFMATRDAFKRSIPGRIIGVSEDRFGKPALRMALQTREQHIRRDKATSNICTAQVLLAVISGFYAVYHGPVGLKTIARRVHRMTAMLAKAITGAGLRLAHHQFFDRLTVHTHDKTGEIVARALAKGINLHRVDERHIAFSLDETVTPQDMHDLFVVLTGHDLAFEELEDAPDGIPDKFRRTSPFLTHPVFNSYHSETEMLRYLRLLENKDIALNRSMIPLGSCTMKLNATTEMDPVTWTGFANIHPFAPRDQVLGYLEMIFGLEEMLEELTGFYDVSMQPNAGSQGEYAGLLTIRSYHEARGEGERNVCLIPSSAHGTNPASAVLAGMEVVVVKCDNHGNIDLADLEEKASAHGERLAALMVTYPSTHGVFETEIKTICQIVHDHGGQVYMDGANFNALVGICRPADIGADVMHMNLHKTFCIPHGGGGPGMGPIGCQEHLAPYLPGHPLNPDCGPDQGLGTVSAAPYGSAGILPISYAYIAMMGGPGLKKATQVAILNANYIAKRLAPHFPIVYTGKGGWIAHECIIDLRQLKEEAGITVDDVAKRLIDYGFHAPTMSWPVAGTMMIEPTESEDKIELDRFCDAMIAIRKEIEQVAKGVWPADDNPLVNAPHPAEELTADEWDHPYSREVACFPVASLRADKYWPPVGRVDNVAGDRHLVCTCPPIEAYQQAAE